MMGKDKLIRICDGVVEGSFYAILAAVTFSISLVEIACVIMILAWAVKKILARDFKSLDSVPARLLALFLLWTLFSCRNSAYFSESFRGVFKLVKYALIFMAAADGLRDDRIVKRALYVIAAVAGVTCLNGLFQYFSGFDLIRHRHLIDLDYLRRISSSFVHPNSFGIYLMMVSLVLLSWLMSGYKRAVSWFWIAGSFALSILCLVLTKSRGAWLSFLAAFLVLGVIRSKRTAGLFLVIVLCVSGALIYMFPDRLRGLTDLKAGTTEERIMLWEGTINMIKEHPVLGFGVNTYSRIFPKYKPADYPDVRYSHNCYLQMASEIGIPGALLFISFLASVLVCSFRGFTGRERGRKEYLAMGLFAALAGFAMDCLVDTGLYSVNLAVFFYLLAGFCFAITRRVEK
ncbi:MAG: O-antigen ligase family protein [Candidatus Omnitrophota bacterium]